MRAKRKLNEWRAMIKKMQSLGYSKDIIENMASQGISSYADVKALTSSTVTPALVDQINQMWEQVGKESVKAADESLGAVAIAGETVGRDTIDGIIAEYKNKQPELESAIDDAGDDAAKKIEDQETKTSKAAMNAVTKTFEKTVSIVSTLSNSTAFPDALKKLIANAIPDSLKTFAYNQANNLGNNVILGLFNGLSNNAAKEKTKKAGKNVANGAILGACSGLGVASPSKEFEWIGQMCVEGLSMGLSNSSYLVEDEMGNLADSLLSYAQAVSDDLANAIDDESEWTIKPVLDLDNLQNANNLIQSLLGNGDIAVRSTALAGQTATQSEWSMLSKALSGVGNTTETNTYGDTTIVVNPPAGSNSREIAQMVMSEIQRQMDRRQRI